MTSNKCPDFATLTDNGKACILKEEADFYCGLTDDSAPGWPRCYSSNGQAVAPPSAPLGTPIGVDTTDSASTKKTLKPSCTDILNVQYANLIDSINQIHAFEGELFKKLETVENGGEASLGADDIRARIGDLSKLRNQLYQDLNNILTSTQCNLADSRQDLADQIAMVQIVQQELDNAEKTIKELQNVRNTRRRMVEITTYEKDRYASHKNIFKVIAFCGLGILMSVILSNKGFVSVGRAGIMVSVAVAIILTCKSIYNMWWKNNMNWNKYNFGSYQNGGANGAGGAGGAGGENVWDYNKRHLEKAYQGAKTELSNVTTKSENAAGKAYSSVETAMGSLKQGTFGKPKTHLSYNQ